MKYYICQSNDWGRWIFIIVKANYKKSAMKKIHEINSTLKPPIKNWHGLVLSEKEIEERAYLKDWLSTHELETLYEGQFGRNDKPEEGKLVKVYA